MPLNDNDQGYLDPEYLTPAKLEEIERVWICIAQIMLSHPNYNPPEDYLPPASDPPLIFHLLLLLLILILVFLLLRKYLKNPLPHYLLWVLPFKG